MGNVLYPPPRPQSVSEVLDAAFRIYSATLLKCLPYSFSSVIVGQLLSVYDLLHRHALTPAAVHAAQLQQVRDPRWWGLLVVVLVASTTFANAVFLRQYALATGHATAMRAELGRALRRVPGVLLMTLLAGLAFAATVIPVMLALMALGGLTGLGRSAPALSSQIGIVIGVFLAMLIAGSWIVIKWVCSVPIYLFGERGPVESMSHSWQLTRGNFWRLSVIYSVGVVLLMVFYALASVVGGAMALFVGRGDLILFLAVTSVVIALLAALFAPFYQALILAVCGDLSVRREGADLAQRISAPAIP